jgi:hypothetical protein
MIPTSSKTIERKRRILTAIWYRFEALLQRNDCTSLPSYSIRDESFSAGYLSQTFAIYFNVDSIQFGHLKLWQNTQDIFPPSHFSFG